MWFPELANRTLNPLKAINGMECGFSLLDDFLANFSKISTPSFDFHSGENGALLTAELSGMKSEDVDIMVTGRNITVSVKQDREDDMEEGKRLCMSAEGQTSADYKNGMLDVTLPGI